MVISKCNAIIIKNVKIYEIGKNINKLKQIAMMALYSDELVYIKYTNETIKNITDEEKSIIKLIENKIVNNKIIKEIFGCYPSNSINKKYLSLYEYENTITDFDKKFVFKEL
jgi:hypothetical protein